MADFSIPAQVYVPKPMEVPNPLAQAGEYARTANALLGLQGAQQQIGTRNALASAYANTPTDAKTGLPDTAALLRNLQDQGPFGGLAIAQVIPSIQAQRKTGYELSAADLKQTTDRLGAFRTAIGPLVAQGQAVTPSQVYNTLKGMRAAGLPTDEVVNYVAATMPSDPGQLGAWVKNTWSGGLGGADQARLFTPNPTAQNLGGAITYQDTNPNTNPGIVGTTLRLGLTPPEQNAQVPGPVGPKGQRTTISGAQYAAQNGNAALLPGGGAGGGYGPSSTSLLPPGYTGRTTAPGALPAGGAAPSSPALPAPGAPMVTALGPGQTNALGDVGAESGKEAAALNASAATIPTQRAQIAAMRGDLTQFGSGPDSAFYSNARGRMVQLGVASDATAKTQAAAENFTKMSNQYLAQQSQALGAVTNDKLALAGESGPNPLFTKLGNQGVLNIADGNLDALQAKNNAWLGALRSGQVQPDDYAQWSATFNQSSGFAPSAFWYARMSPDQRSTMVAGMAAPDKAQLAGNIQTAVRNGWIDPAMLTPSAGAAAPSQAVSASTPAAAPPAVNLGLGNGSAVRGY